ncbi:elongation factor 1-gamma [Mayamaea pseudoterrestris]|nr:elongation factor 1-gamma [Mayamaea pseudoterrestris]GKZ01128.1 elongation factor 1-gamma [Mayamaea pseudoterrestris]
MPAPSYTLYAPEASFRAFSVLIAAEYNGVSINVDTDLKHASKSPVGKLPLLQLPDGSTIFSSHAMAKYVAGLRRDTGLLGETSQETAAIDAWMDWASHDVELPACVWFYPAAGYIPFQENAYIKAKTDLAAALTVLDGYLLDKTYLVSNQVTLADIVVASTLLYPFKLVCDKNFIKPFGNVMRWFNTCVNQPEFVQVVGKVTLCKKELLAKGQSAGGAAAPKKDAKKKEDKNEAAAEVDSEVAPVKKEEHPYKIMDRETPSPFIMDAWKKQYSNAPTYEESMKWFWENFDANGYSLWLQNYKYNEENKMVFMTSNAVGGFQQRSDEVRKWAFGVMDVLGTEDTTLEIKGVWLLRGQTVEYLLAANDDANWYDWTKLDPTNEEHKQIVQDYWCSEETLEDKPIQDSKVFK